MPLWAINFIGGFFLGYYLLNDTVRHLINQILLTLLKLAHRLIVLLLGSLLRGLNWLCKPRERVQQPFKVKSYTPTPVPAQKAHTGARKGVLADGDKVISIDGKNRIWFSDKKIAEMMAENPELKISKKDKEN